MKPSKNIETLICFFDRLDKYMKYKGLNDNKITIEAGISNGLIGKGRKRGSLSQENISKILYKYDDLNADWLLTGRGSMLKPPGLMDDAEIAAQDEEVRRGKVSVYQYDPKDAIITAKDESIAAHKKTIASNEVTIGALQARIRDLEAQLHSSSTVLDNAPAVDIPSVGARTQTSAK